MRRNRNNQGKFADSDVQMMETDIMRFLAMIALCLAIIFAIVSGSGASDEKKANSPASVDPVTTLDEVKAKPEQAVKPEKLAQVVLPQQEKSKQAEQAEQSMPTPTPPPTKQNKKQQVKQKKGYQLTFASDTVFTQLVQQHTIQLYKITKDLSYRWQQGWHVENKPQQYYQLHVETLPDRYQQQVKLNDNIGVVLPDHTQAALQQLTEQYESGLLVIGHKALITRKPL